MMHGQKNIKLCGYILIFCDVDVTGIICLSVYSKYFISPVLNTVTEDERFSCTCVAYC
jgi:hypothetical protein